MRKNLFAWASISEKGTINGKAGDQTGKEVKTGYYYDFGQDKCIRVKPLKTRRKIAKIAKELALNNRIGYGQADRKTLWEFCNYYGWDWKRIKNTIPVCNVDCSMFCAIAVNLGFGRAVFDSTTYTGNMCTQARNKSKYFSVESIKQAEKKFHKADMPIKEGKHVIINV